MFNDLWEILVSVSLCMVAFENLRLRRDVQKCLRILYDAANPDQEVPGDD